MTPIESVSVLRHAHRCCIPPMQFSVLCALVNHTNYRWKCHPGQRLLSRLCSINKDSVTMCVKWLHDRDIIKIEDRAEKKRGFTNHYEIMPYRKWKICPTPSDTLRRKVSDHAAHFSSKKRPTPSDTRKSNLQRECPTPSDVTIDSAQGAIGNAIAFEELENEASPPVNGHRLAF